MQVVDGSKKRKREDQEGQEEELDVYKLQYASDSYPEDSDGKSADQEGGEETEETEGMVVVVVREDGKVDGDTLRPAALESEGGVSSGLIELEKILGASPAEPTVLKPLLDERESQITDDRLIDYDSQASDYEGDNGHGKANEEMVDDNDEEGGDADETSSFSADMSLASDDDSGADSDSTGDSSDSDSDSDAEEISSKAPPGNPPPLAINTDPSTSTQPNLKKERGKRKKPCKSFQTTGECRYGDTCRNSHISPTSPKVRDREGGAGGEERVSLHERMMRQQRERENEVVVRAVRWLFESGGLEKPADAGDIEKEMREEEKRREEGRRGVRNRRGGGGFGGRRGGRRGGQVSKLPSGRGRFKRRGGGGGRGSGV